VEASKNDKDTAHLIEKLSANAAPIYSKLQCKAYYNHWTLGHLEVQDDILYHWEEPKMRQIGQLRHQVVPKGMRHLIHVAYHSSGMAGHVGLHKTYYRIIAGYWWPNVFVDVRENVRNCGFCVLGNNVSHKAQQILGKIDTDEPFDVISVDIWIPGETTPMLKHQLTYEEDQEGQEGQESQFDRSMLIDRFLNECLFEFSGE
jgi:hypothetical protein